MAKRKHREHDPTINETKSNTNTNSNTRNMPFGIDPMQLMGLFGGNLDVNNMGNMLSSMNTNGFNLGNLGNLGSIAQMMGLNLDNNFLQGNMTSLGNDFSKNMHQSGSQNMNTNSSNTNSVNTNSKSSEASNLDRNNKKSTNSKNSKEDDVNLNFLIALKSHVHPDRIKFIDKIIEAYKNGEFKET
jgi:hypothetical protein